jgi:hypothetical protein
VEEIELGRTNIPQLTAAFGQPVSRGGRPTRIRFDYGDCMLFVTVTGETADEIELASYGTLDFILERYGDPAAVGISEGSFALLALDNTVLLYPDEGIIVVFEVPPDQLTPSTPVSSLFFRPPFEIERQVTRLDLQLIDWEPPLR